MLRLIFCDPRVRAAQYDWESAARFVLGAFRLDAARAGAAAESAAGRRALPAEPGIRGDVARERRPRARRGGQALAAPIAGPIAFEYSAFAVDGRPDLSMVVYNPATPEDAERIKSLLA